MKIESIATIWLAVLIGVSMAPPVTAQSKEWIDVGFGSGPLLEASAPRFGRHVHFRLSNAMSSFEPVVFVIGLTAANIPLPGGTLVPNPDLLLWSQTVFGISGTSLRVPHFCHLETPVYVQAVINSPAGLRFSNALRTTLKDHVPSDFNGDGIADVAIGVPGEDVSGFADAGAVNVIYGGGALPSQLIRQGFDLNGMVLNTPEEDDRFGSALATGDFDGDGFCDLAVGVPREDSTGPLVVDSGIVQVFYGSPLGLQAGATREDQLFRQGLQGVPENVEAYDWFGKSLAAGDFDGDGCDDLAIGSPYENRTHVNQGIVIVLFGSSADGLTGQGSVLIEDVGAAAHQDDRFGWNLAAGDFNADGYYELAVGNPYVDVLGNQDAGVVRIVRPVAVGVGLATPLIHQSMSLNGFAILETAETYDLFGFSLAVGDFNDDGVDDLAVGVPYEDLSGNSISAAGAVNVLYGEWIFGLTGEGNQLWHQDAAGISEVAELGDNFGYALASGDFNGDGACDLAVASPRERIGAIRMGVVQTLYGTAGTGLTAAGNQLWHQDVAGVLDIGSDDDLFGFALYSGDFDGDCLADLAVGVPGEDIDNRNDSGAVQVLFGSPFGITSVGNELWSQLFATPGAPQVGDRFGAALVGSPDQAPL